METDKGPNPQMPQEAKFYIERFQRLLGISPIDSAEANAYFDWISYINSCLEASRIGNQPGWLRQAIAETKLASIQAKQRIGDRFKCAVSDEYKAASTVVAAYTVQMGLLYDKLLEDPDKDSRYFVLQDLLDVANSVYGKELVERKLTTWQVALVDV